VTTPQPHPYKFFLGDLVDGSLRTLDFLPDSPLPRFPDRTPGSGRMLAPLYIPVPRQWRTDDLVNEIGDFLEGEGGESDVLVFRTHGDEGRRLIEASGYLPDRAKRPVWLLELEQGKPRLLDISTGKSPFGPEEDEGAYLDLLRECELTSYTRVPGVYLESSETFHYVAPNRTHYRTFLRVGSMLSSLDAVDALCFWVAPRIGDAKVLLLDSSTILSVGLRAAEYLEATRQRPAGDRLGVEALRSYREPEVTLGPRLEPFAEGGGRLRPRLVFLESVSSTGALVDYVRDTCETHLGFNVSAVPIFSATSTAERENLDPLCHAGDVSAALDLPCELCREGSQRVYLLSSSYTLEVAAEVDKASLTKKDAERGYKYLEDYAGKNCVSLHRTEPDSGRHHMVYIDAGELLASSQKFKARLRKRLDSAAGEAGAILTPTHGAAVKLGGYAARRLDLSMLNRDEQDLPKSAPDFADLPEEWLEALREKPLLLLVDDVLITGARLRRYLDALEPLFEAVPGLQLTYLVGVARPQHRDSLTSIPKMLMGRGSFAAVEEIVLPHWGPTDCPWCRELKAIDALRNEGVTLSGALLERYKLLADVKRGIRGDEALLSWDGDEIKGLSGSIFGEGQQAEVFLSIASSLQSLRNDQKLVEEFRPPVAKVLHPVETFDQRFFEYRLQLLILRACRPHDLNSRLVQRDLVHMFRTRLAGDHDPSDREPCEIPENVREQRAELLLAAAQDKLPREWLLRGGDSDEESRWIEHVLNDGDATICELLRATIDQASAGA
jgi:hypothetical protein